MCPGRTGSPAPLGSSAAFREHHSLGLRGFFWQMSPARDESALPLSAQPAHCFVRGVGLSPRASPAALCTLPAERGEALPAAQGQELSPAAGRALLGQLELRGQTDTSVQRPRGRGLQLPSPAQPVPSPPGGSQRPAAKAVHSNDSQWEGEMGGKAQGEGWELRARPCPGVPGGMLRLQISQKRQS